MTNTLKQYKKFTAHPGQEKISLNKEEELGQARAWYLASIPGNGPGPGH